MKRSFYVFLLMIFTLLVFSTCSGMPKVKRVDADTQIDLSGRWNDTDVRIVCESLINDCLASPRVSQFVQQYASQHNGNLPACLVGSFKNESSEHIDTLIISTIMESTIVNSGRLDFVAGGDTRAEIRGERQDQQSNASEATAAALGYETIVINDAVRGVGLPEGSVERAFDQLKKAGVIIAESGDIG